ncbi:MAG: alanine dehydrogenase [Bacteroidetes bacterium]|nr:alanine dehydrogenase [Bacteroidota bacterium]
MKIGLIKETKSPPDSRVPLIPAQAAIINQFPNIELVVAPSPSRCFEDTDYEKKGLQLQEDLSDCDILLGVKEVEIETLLPNKTYFFFSHTIKEQAYNRDLLLAILEKNIRLIDYEVLTNEKGKRLIAFGRFAGMVGAHNALWTYGKRTGKFELKRMKDCYDYAEAKVLYQEMEWPPLRIVLTGTGRVGQGAAEVLRDMGIKEVSSNDFLSNGFEEPVFTQLQCSDYAARKDGTPFKKKDFYQHPEAFKSIFAPYAKSADIFINGIYWDNNAPAFFTLEEMASSNFNLQVIADVTCDIAPVSSIPSTIKASTIADPVFGFSPNTREEIPAFSPDGVDMMTIDNLPNELPRDASESFGKQFLESILPELQKEESDILTRATVAQNGALGPHFGYLKNYISF